MGGFEITNKRLYNNLILATKEIDGIDFELGGGSVRYNAPISIQLTPSQRNVLLSTRVRKIEKIRFKDYIGKETGKKPIQRIGTIQKAVGIKPKPFFPGNKKRP